MENFLDVPAVLVKQDKLIEVEAGWTSRASPHEQFAFGVTGHFRDFGSLGLRFGQTGAEIVEKLPTGKLLLIDLVLGASHERRETDQI